MGNDDKLGRFTIGKSEEKDGDDGEDKLIELYRNRAGLKKEFQSLRQQRDDLRDDLEKRSETIDRLKSELASFESLLVDPDSAFNVMAFYQLRGLWRDSQSRLKNLIVDMAQKRKTRERQRIAEEFSEKQAKRIEIIREREDRLRGQRDEQGRALELLGTSLASMKGFWSYFKRRELSRQIGEARRRCDVLEVKIEEFVSQRNVIDAERPGDYDGLTVGGQRAINMVCLAMSQFLYDHYSMHGLYGVVYHAMMGKPQDASYGARRDCEILMQKIMRAQNTIDGMADFTETIRQRTETIRSQAQYRTDDDTIPLANSLANLPTSGGGFEGDGKLPKHINLIADDIWDISEILLE